MDVMLNAAIDDVQKVLLQGVLWQDRARQVCDIELQVVSMIGWVLQGRWAVKRCAACRPCTMATMHAWSRCCMSMLIGAGGPLFPVISSSG